MNFSKLYRNCFGLFIGVLVCSLYGQVLVSKSAAQEMVLGGLMPAQKKKNEPANARIKSEWGKPTNEWSIRIGPGAKTRWGIAEAPTFLLQAKNTSKVTRKLEISEKDLQVTINGKVYQWDSPGTKLITELAPGETRENLFIIRLDRSQWKPAEPNVESATGKLPALTEGTKSLEVLLTLKDGSEKPPVLKSSKVDIVITKSAFEMPTVGGVLVGHDGKPIKDADIYLCRDAQFSIYYSSYDGKWFKSKSVSHYDPFGGGLGQALKPVKTNAKGEFTLSPGFRDKRIVVLPPFGSAQVFPLPNNFNEWKVKLQQGGSLLIEHDIEGESGTSNASLYSTRRMGFVKSGNNRISFMLTENFSVPLTNGQKYEFNNLAPEAFRLNRYKYVRIGNRSYSIGRRNMYFDIEPGKKTEFRMVRKTGQKISLTATHVPNNMQYVVAGVYELDESINLTSVYSNQTLWADASAENNRKLKFKSALISPGKYRLVVMSVPQGKKPNQYTYKPDFIGSKIIEVGESGEIDAGEIRLMPKDLWVHNSGMALSLKIVTFPGEVGGAQTVWPVNIGYGQGFDAREFRTNSSGEGTALRPPGKYKFATGLDSDRATFFEVRVPRMTPRGIVISDRREWAADSDKKPDLSVSAKLNKDGKILVDVENKGKVAYTTQMGDIQLLVQKTINNYSTGVRFLPPEQSSVYGREVKPNSKIQLELNYRDMLSKGICTSARLSKAKLQEFKATLDKKQTLAGLKFGPTYSKPFVVPALPTLPLKPFR